MSGGGVVEGATDDTDDENGDAGVGGTASMRTGDRMGA